MNRIKVSTLSGWPFIRQTPHSLGIWDDCAFFIDKSVSECDWWVVCEGLSKEDRVICPRKNTILLTFEPESVKQYNQEFLNQFGMVITSQRRLHHNNVIYSQQGLPWIVGINNFRDMSVRSTLSRGYDELKDITPEKTKLISMVISNKKGSEGHKQRLKFAIAIKKYFGNKIDIFANGFPNNELAGYPLIPFKDKWDAIAPYRYHVVVENSSFEDYWTEKLADSYLADSYPFYYGCPNVEEYFSRKSFTAIDIYKFKEAIMAIENAINENVYLRSSREIKEAKMAILDQYQLFPMICNLIKGKAVYGVTPEMITLKPEVRLGFLNRLWNKAKYIYYSALPV